MPYNRWKIVLEGATDAAFTTPASFDLYVKVADPDSDPIGEPRDYFGYIRRRDRTGRRLTIKVELYPLTVGASDWDGTDYEAFESFLEYPFLRIASTTVPRLSTVYASLFPLEVDWDGKSKSLNAKEARNEVSITLTSVYPV